MYYPINIRLGKYSCYYQIYMGLYAQQRYV